MEKFENIIIIAVHVSAMPAFLWIPAPFTELHRIVMFPKKLHLLE
jgi:hypothetical protein